MDMLKSAGSGLLHAGERVAGDAVRKEIARRIGEEDLSLWDMVKSAGSAALHEAAPVVGAALRDEVKRDLGE